MSDLKVSISVGATLDPSYQKTLDRADRGAKRYGEEVGAIARAHKSTGDPLPDAERGYASGERAAEAYGREVGQVTTEHKSTGDPLPDAERGYASGERAAESYGREVGQVTTEHQRTGDPLPDAERGYASGERAAEAYGREVGQVTTEHKSTGDPLPDAERGYASGERAAEAYGREVGQVTTEHKSTGDPLPDAERGYASGERAAESYGREVGQVTTEHKSTGDPLPDAERGYASGERAAESYGREVGQVTTEHKSTGDPLPDAERGYASGERAAESYGREVGQVTTEHKSTGDPLPDAERGYASGERAAESYGREVGQVTKAHDKLQEEMDETARTAKRTAEAARNEAQKRKDEAGRNLRDMSIMGASVLYGFGRLAGGAIETEEQLLNLRTVLEVDDKDAAMERSLAHARDLARRTLGDEREFLEIEYALNSAGLGEEMSRTGIELVHQVAKVTRGSADKVGEVVGITFNTMAAGMTGTAEEKLGRIGDVLAKTQFRYQIRDFGQLGEGIAEAASAATTNRVPFETLAASIGLLNSAGQQGGEAGTAFNAVMRSMNKAAEELGFEIARTGSGEFDMLTNLALIEEGLDGLSIDERAQSLQDIFGDEGRVGIAPLLAGMDALREGIGVMHGARGTVEEAYRPFQESMGGQWKMLGQNVKQVGEIFAGTLLPALNSVVEPMVTGAAWVSEMIQEYPQLGRLVGALAVGFGIAATALAVVSAATWVWNAALLANPITWVVGTFILGASLLVTYWEPVTEFFRGLWDEIIKVGDALKNTLVGRAIGKLTGWWDVDEDAPLSGTASTKMRGGRYAAQQAAVTDSSATSTRVDDHSVAKGAALSIGLLAGAGASAADTPATSIEPNAAIMSEWQSVLDARPDIAAEREAVDQAAADSIMGDARAYIDFLGSETGPRAGSGLSALLAAQAGEGGASPAAVVHDISDSRAARPNNTFNISITVNGGVSPEVVEEVQREMERVMRRASVEAGLAESDDVY